MQTVAESTAAGGQARAQLWKQAGQAHRIIRQGRAVEAGGIGHQSPGGQGKQLHVAGGVPAPLQAA